MVSKTLPAGGFKSDIHAIEWNRNEIHPPNYTSFPIYCTEYHIVTDNS